jgi:hypothetical protein
LYGDQITVWKRLGNSARRKTHDIRKVVSGEIVEVLWLRGGIWDERCGWVGWVDVRALG